MLDFQQYQAQFTAHIRHPSTHKKPARVPDKRMAVYREIVFNNVFGTVSACFPVCRQVLGVRAWRRLVRGFFAQHHSNTPIFREIPQQFLQFLETKDMPNYLPQLAHYEWAELAVSTVPNDAPPLSARADLLKEKPILAPHLLLEYDYPVHKISARFKPTAPEGTYLLVYRRADFSVEFIELNQMTFALIKLLQDNLLTGEQAVMQLTEHISNYPPELLLKFGLEILQNLAKQGAILGSQKT